MAPAVGLEPTTPGSKPGNYANLSIGAYCYPKFVTKLSSRIGGLGELIKNGADCRNRTHVT